MTLTAFNVRKEVQMASFYTAYKSSLFIEKESDGGKVDGIDIKRLMTISALIGSIDRYGTIYKQPTFTFSVDTPRSNAVVTMTFGDVVIGPVTIKSNSQTGSAKEIADFINEENLGFTAESNNQYVTVSAVDGSESNGIAADVSGSGGIVIGLPFPTEFSDDGMDYFSENTDRYLDDSEIEMIIDKINKLIDEPFSKYINV